jgi:hypothetical protein
LGQSFLEKTSQKRKEDVLINIFLLPHGSMCLKRTLKSRNILAKCSKQDKKKIFTKFRPEMEIKFARKVLRKNIGVMADR